MSMYICCDDDRRNKVRNPQSLNGIDFLEVRDDASMPQADRQRFLDVTLFKSPATLLTAEHVRIEGGAAVRGVRAVHVSQSGTLLTVEVDRPGDYSTYTLRLVAAGGGDAPPPGFDPLLAAIDFSFKVNCETDWDCQEQAQCPPNAMSPFDLEESGRVLRVPVPQP